MSNFVCPYCKAESAESGESCSACGVRFPWSEALAQVRTEMKEREVNRGRATFTLIDEMFHASQGGKPISVSAIKGFAFAWLFPRTLIVLGSIATGLVLAVQTYILYQQTRQLESQTRAAQVEQAEKLRERIASTERHLQYSRYVANASGPTRGRITCMPVCARANVQDALNAILSYSRNESDLPLGSLGKDLLFSMETQVDALRAVERPAAALIETDPDGIWGVRNKALESAALACLLPPEDREKLNAGIRILRQWSRDRTNDKALLGREVSALLVDVRLGGPTTMQDLATLLSSAHDQLSSAASALVERCSRAAAHDRRVLEQIESGAVQ